MSKSVYVRFRGRNHLAINHLSPLDTTDDGISFYADKELTTVIGKLNYTSSQFQFDSLGELTTGVGVTIDSVLLKDGSTILPNDTYYQAKNSAGTPQDILKINGSNNLILSPLWNTAATRASLGAAASGANSDITSLSRVGGRFDISSTGFWWDTTGVTLANGVMYAASFNPRYKTSGGTTYLGGFTIEAGTDGDKTNLLSRNPNTAAWLDLNIYADDINLRPNSSTSGVVNLYNYNGDVVVMTSYTGSSPNLRPPTDLATDLGTTSTRFRNIYCEKIIPASAASYDFTSGSGASNFDLTSDSMSTAQICQSLRAFHRALIAAGIIT